MNKVKIVELAWLAGLIDGEGTIGMYAIDRNKPSFKCKVYIRYQIGIANDDVNIIAEAVRIIENIIESKVHVEASSSIDRRFIHHKIDVWSQRKCAKLLSIVEPYLIGKKAQAQVLLKLLRSHKSHTRYTRAELDVIDILKRMKNDNKLSAEVNAEPSREDNSQACVENIWGAAQSEFNFGLKTCSEPPAKAE
jgi:hypothetical protein